ncbi:MAG: hypothetical protein M3388_16015 [Acidobacteriota bacterium]|nr:hypothetical protein [Acidobacteriota bacterium]
MNKINLVDTGSLIAVLHRRDQFHAWAVEQIRLMPAPPAHLRNHALNTEARRDRYKFLRTQLKLKRIDLKNFDNVREIK